MTKKTTLTLIMGASLFLGGTTVAVAAPDGAALAKEKCESCHGSDGNSKYDELPNIAGLSEYYLTETMKAYAKEKDDGGRPSDSFKAEGQEETNMKAVVQALSEDQIKALAKYFSEQEFEAREQEFDADLAKAGKKVYKKRCKKCHTDKGREAEDDAGILAGQSMTYMRNQLKYFEDGSRWMDDKMAKQFKKLKEGDLEKLIHFFAKQQ
jgi:cytochrome subunit of sulfide dehydrogenase